MEVWSSGTNKRELLKSLDSIKGNYKKSRITRNKYKVYILWIDSESQKKMWHGK